MLSQQLASPQFSLPEEVVAHLGAVQAQEYRLMRWAVAMRTRKPSASAFCRAYDSGRIIRVHLFRGTWQLVSGDDYRWMMDLCSGKARRVIEGWMHANHISIPDEEYLRIKDIMVRCAGDLGSVTKEDIVKALARYDITMDDHRLSYHIRMAELDGTLCSGNLHPLKATYSLAVEKVPEAAALNNDEAMALLTRKYFQSHSPATLEDFIWWTGMNAGECLRGIAALGSELRTERWNDTEFYIHENARIRGFRSGSALLLPPYDEYLIGYKSRGIVLPEEHRHRAHNNSGNFYPIVLRDGIVCGCWKPFEKTLTADLFDGSSPDFLSPAWNTYRTFLKR